MFNKLLQYLENNQEEIVYEDVRVNELLDNKVVKRFMAANELHTDEIMVYAKAFHEYVKAYDCYRTYYKVITINERDGVVSTYKQYASSTPVSWSKRRNI